MREVHVHMVGVCPQLGTYAGLRDNFIRSVQAIQPDVLPRLTVSARLDDAMTKVMADLQADIVFIANEECLCTHGNLSPAILLVRRMKDHPKRPFIGLAPGLDGFPSKLSAWGYGEFHEYLFELPRLVAARADWNAKQRTPPTV